MGRSADFPISSYKVFSPLNEMDSTLYNHRQSCSTNSSPKSKEQSLPDRIIKHALEGAEEGILCLFCIMNSLFTLVRAFSFAFGGLQAATKVHNNLLSKLINAPAQFFDQTPGGRILIRLSSDLYTIDDSLPFIINILLANFVGLLGIAIILSYVQDFFLVLLLPFWYIYSRLQFFYRSTSRELRRLDSVSRSPIYMSFTETLDGSSTIRAFKSEDYFFAKFIEHVTLYQKTSYTEIVASLWLSLRLQAEQGNPQVLLNDGTSLFSSFVKASSM